jgi:general secretion pathway protein E/type IV pilus assembly protein PilB
VFSTLHTNDAAGAITRLIDLGVKPFLVAASLRAVLAQRLVRRLCMECRQPGQTASHAFEKGAGCSGCQGTGYRGQCGIFELLIINDELRALIHGNTSAAQLREKARRLGMSTMREDGLRKATAGLTTVEEVVSITASDHI